MMPTPIKKFIYRYAVIRDGEWVENNLIGWRTALARARKWSRNLFDEPKQVEILNIWTGEIITLEQAEKRVAKTLKGASHCAAT